jgi:acyl-CoA synthetase (AMP-forming)/AMP-acid ligase II
MISTVIDAQDGLPLTFPALLRRQTELHGPRTLAAFDDERITYAEAEARSRRLARGLLAAGVKKGDRVAILHPQTPDFITALFAILRIGAVAAPLSTLSTPDELRGLLTGADINYVFAAPGYRNHRYDEALQSAFPELDYTRPPPVASLQAPWLKRIWFSGPAPAERHPGWSVADLESAADSIDDAHLDAIEARVTPADRLFIIHTSGSTSRPKGVVHQHGSVIRTLNNVNEIRGWGPDQRLYATSPWFWVAGLSYSFLGVYLVGASIIVANAVEPSAVLDVLERERPTNTLGYWQTVSRLAADPSFEGRDLSSITGGLLFPIMVPERRPKDPNLRHSIYGMTEVAGALTLWPDENDLPEHQRGSMGKILPGFEHKVLDLDTGHECAPGEQGELWIRGPFMMEGYYGRLRSEVFQPDNWWRTGDVVAIDADGFVYLKGRLGDMIKTAGANVSPREVEAVITEITGGQLCIALGLPDPTRGQIVAAVVVGEHEVDEAALRKAVAARLSSYKVPRRIISMRQAEVPVLSTSKTDMRSLAAMVQARCDAAPAAETA